jgi:hypothetical protein
LPIIIRNGFNFSTKQVQRSCSPGMKYC